MSYNKVNWTEELDENDNPETPVSAENLGKMDDWIDDVDKGETAVPKAKNLDGGEATVGSADEPEKEINFPEYEEDEITIPGYKIFRRVIDPTIGDKTSELIIARAEGDEVVKIPASGRLTLEGVITDSVLVDYVEFRPIDSEPSIGGNNAALYLDSSDDSLKIKYPDGTIETVTSD